MKYQSDINLMNKNDWRAKLSFASYNNNDTVISIFELWENNL